MRNLRGQAIAGAATAVALIFGALTALPAAASAVLNVNQSGSDSGNCVDTACATINYAIAQAATGDTIQVAAGTYASSVTVSKDVDIVGAGDGDGQTLLSGGVTISASGASLADSLTVSDVRITSSSGTGLTVANGVSNLRVEDSTVIDSAGSGVSISGGAATNNDLVFDGVELISNSGSGLVMGADVRVDGLTLINSTVSNNAGFGFSYNSSETSTSLTDLLIESTTFYNNSTGASQVDNTGSGDVSLYKFNGNATLREVTISAPNDSDLTNSGLAIIGKDTTQGGFAAAGNIVLDTVYVSGFYQRKSPNPLQSLLAYGIVIGDYTNTSSTITMTDVVVDLDSGNALTVWGLGFPLDIGNATLRAKNTSYGAIYVGAGSYNAKTIVDATDAFIDVSTSGFLDPIATGTASDAQLFAMSNRIADAVDFTFPAPALTGHVYLKANTLYATPNSFVPGLTTLSLQRAIDTAAAGDTVQVAAGTYAENLTINKNLSLVGPNSTISALGGDWDDRAAEAVIGANNSATRVTISGTPTVTISGVKFVGPASGVATAATGIAASGDSSVTVTNNWFDTLANQVVGYVSAGGADIYPQGGSATGNWVISGNRHDGPAVGGDTATAPYSFSAINAWNLNSVTIHGNRIEGYGFAGIQLEGTKQGNITSNFIKDVGANGIQVANGAVGPVVVRGNTINNASSYYSTLAPTPGADPFAADQIDPDYCWAGIRVWNSSANGAVEITNNLIQNTPGRCGAIGFTNTTNQAISKIENNSIDGTNVDGISDNGHFFVESYAVSNNVATITTYGASSRFAVGDDVTITGLGSPFNGTHVLTAASSNSSTWISTVSFALTTANVAQTFVNRATSNAVILPEAWPASPIDAEGNWWGSSAGPGASGNSKNRVASAADVSPWISSFTNGSAAEGYIDGIGFWPTGVKLFQSVAITSSLSSSEGTPEVDVQSTFTVSGTASSGNSVVLTSLTPGVCSLTSGLVSLVTRGTCTIQVAQAGDSTFAPATATYSVSALAPARTPTFGQVTRTSGGFRFQVMNYSALWDWQVTVSAGEVEFTPSTGVVEVTDLADSTSSTVTVTTSRSQFRSGSASLVSSSLAPLILPALTPSFGNPVRTIDGFTVQLSNHSRLWTWSATASNESAVVSVSQSGLVTVGGLQPGEASTVTVSTVRTGYFDGEGTSSSTAALMAALVPSLGTASASTNGFTVPISNFDSNFNWTATPIFGGSATVIDGELVVTGLGVAERTTVVVSATRSGYLTGQGSVSAASQLPARTPSFGQVTRTADGFSFSIMNSSSLWDWDATASAGSASVSLSGLVTVTGLSPSESATVTVTSSRNLYAEGSATLTATALPPALSPARVPTFGSPLAFPGGFMVPITNHSALWEWTVTPSAGSATVASNGLIIVTGLEAGVSATVDVGSARSGFQSGSAISPSGTSLQPALNPTFGSISSISGGFTVPITNYDSSYNWQFHAPLGGSVSFDSISQTVSITGLALFQRGMISVTTARSGYGDGSNTVTGFAQRDGRTPLFMTNVTRTSNGFTVGLRNFASQWTWIPTVNVNRTLAPNASASILSGRVVVTNLPAGVPATVTVKATRAGYADASATTPAYRSAG